ncbi:MAG: hypothetical protein G8237_07530 [Magnetococcales bacterium]|nr:hypothetical protein [Magnetococcales bacterium]
MKNNAVRQRLRAFNPLASVAAGNPWDSRLIDLAAINQAPFEGVKALFRQAAQAPGEPLAALILGEVGNGKSHLVARWRLACQSGRKAGGFALLTPPEGGTAPFCYLLREIADGLRQPMGQNSGLSTWHHLAAWLLVVEGQGKKERSILDDMRQGRKRGVRWWKGVQDAVSFDRLPPEARSLAKVLVRWLPGSASERREALTWLRGEARILNHLPRRLDRSLYTVEQREEEARALLLALGALFAHVGRPLLVCFDRMEELRTPAQHAAMDQIVTFLVDRMAATVPVVLARGQFWEELRQARWNAQTVGRLESNRHELNGCARAEAELLVRLRLEAVLGSRGMEALFFDPAVLLERLPAGRNTPRVVLTLANARLRELLDLPVTVPETPRQRLDTVWEGMVRQLPERLREEPLRPERIAQVLRLYLFGEQTSGEQEDSGWIELPATGSQPAWLWMVESQFHPKAMIHRLEAGLEWMQHHPGGVVTYVRDGRFVIPRLPKWPETNRVVQRFQEQGGRMLHLTPERALRWYLLGELHDAVRCGEITWMDGLNREQPVGIATLIEFLRSHFSGETEG